MLLFHTPTYIHPSTDPQRTTRLRKLIEAYCDAEKTGRGNLRFLFDGEHIGDEQTPAELDMEDGDVIDVLEGQVGGGVAVAPAAAVSEY